VFSTNDTIVAIATPPGRGGIGVVRISGPDAHRLACALTGRSRGLEPRRATLARVRSAFPSSDLDQVVATYFAAPRSYTGEDVVELSAHGSPVVLRSIVQAAMDAGARLAEPGEFTLRAFLNGRIDLMQAEAVADLIDAVTPLQARTAFDQLQGTLTRTIAEIDAMLFDLVARLEASVDFPEEGYHFIEPASVVRGLDAVISRTGALLADARRGRLVREGLQIAIVGRPNVGKSSLFNALAGSARAIVTDIPGTTRDMVSETIDLAGLRVTLVDTAGLRETVDPIESEGVRRTGLAAGVADLILIVADVSEPLQAADLAIFSQYTDNKRLIVASKSDVRPAWSRSEAIPVSVVTGEGLDNLRSRILEAIGCPAAEISERPEITNVRHVALVDRAHRALTAARSAVVAEGGSLSEEFVLADLEVARQALEEVAGKRTPDDVLTHIFERFCVGK
jgi:tRNA modification GTPase